MCARRRDDPGFSVLVVDDEALFARSLAREIRRKGMECDVAGTAGDALRSCEAARYDAILLDHRLPDDDGIRIIPLLRSRLPEASIVVMTAYQAIPDAIQAIRQGAEDYLVKETSTRPLVKAVLAIRRRRSVGRREGKDEAGKTDELIGSSPGIRAVRMQIERVAARPTTTVVFTGETGVGKEVAARMLHALSGGPDRPFVAVDCMALPDQHVESMLFGHVKGAFPGADHASPGAFGEAADGTIFLDEIGEMNASLQGKLLRVLESRTYSAVGSVKEQVVRARVVAATNRDLSEQVRLGRFRFDLYQRLNVFPIEIPPLRLRRDDIGALARHFVEFFAARMGVETPVVAQDAEAVLAAYSFPGNVRELRNIIERAMILSDGGVIEARHLPGRVLMKGEEPGGGVRSLGFEPGVDTLESLEVKMIRRAMEQAGGVKTEAARLLGISRFQLLRRLEKHGIGTRKGED